MPSAYRSATDKPVQNRPYLVTRVPTSCTRYSPKAQDLPHLACNVPQNPHNLVDLGAESQGPCHRVPPILHYSQRDYRVTFTATGLSPDALGPLTALDTCRAHWRCENNPHWTVDAELMEDRRRLAWSRHPQGSLVVSALRMMALCILAVARKLSRLGYSKETPSWGQVAEHFLLQLCASNPGDQGLRLRLSSRPGVGLLQSLIVKKPPPGNGVSDSCASGGGAAPPRLRGGRLCGARQRRPATAGARE